ncbi:MAG: hypothetical protein AABZ74_14270, partial [Cyanobacteriota bacterium]
RVCKFLVWSGLGKFLLKFQNDRQNFDVSSGGLDLDHSSFWINAKRNDKNWEEISNFDRKKINAWSCQEYTFMENNIIQGVYYNPDIIFNYE